MNTIRLNRLALISLVTLLAQPLAHASETAPSRTDGYALYRCSVLGDSRACAQPAEQPATVQLVPGAYAAYLINLGTPREQAIALARAIGEQPTSLQKVPASTQPLSAFEVYERVMGRAPATASSTTSDAGVAGVAGVASAAGKLVR